MGSDLNFDFTTTLTAGEILTLDGAYAAWSPVSTVPYASNFRVETVAEGRITKVEWFETDNGSGNYSGLAQDEVYQWRESTLKSKTSTSYYKDGSVIPGSVVVETYYTASGGRRVTKRETS